MYDLDSEGYCYFLAGTLPIGTFTRDFFDVGETFSTLNCPERQRGQGQTVHRSGVLIEMCGE